MSVQPWLLHGGEQMVERGKPAWRLTFTLGDGVPLQHRRVEVRFFGTRGEAEERWRKRQAEIGGWTPKRGEHVLWERLGEEAGGVLVRIGGDYAIVDSMVPQGEGIAERRFTVALAGLRPDPEAIGVRFEVPAGTKPTRRGGKRWRRRKQAGSQGCGNGGG